MAGVPDKTVARVWSQYEQVKDHIAHLHMGFVTAVFKLQAAKMSGHGTASSREHRIRAYQNLAHLRHFGVLAGAILDPKDEKLEKIDGYLNSWENVTVKDLLGVVKTLEDWFAASYFYDVRVNEENRQIIDIQATLKAAGL